MKDPESKSAFYHEVAKKLCSFTEKIERDIYIQAVAEKYMLPTQDLQRLVGKYGMQMEGIRKQPTQLKTGINEKKRLRQRNQKRRWDEAIPETSFDMAHREYRIIS